MPNAPGSTNSRVAGLRGLYVFAATLCRFFRMRGLGDFRFSQLLGVVHLYVSQRSPPLD